MSDLLWIGSVLGALVGVAHAIYLLGVSAHEPRGRGAGIYRAIWAIGLWSLFGTYVLVLWVVGVIAYGLAGFWPNRRKA